jgi:CheY-like chemotaxis protein
MGARLIGEAVGGKLQSALWLTGAGVPDTVLLLVEDNPIDAYFVEREFKQCPVHVHLRHVRDGAEAIRYLEGQDEYADRQTYPLPNVILLDFKMPRLNGVEFVEWLRSKAPMPQRVIPIVVMSSSTLQEDVERAYAAGANSYLAKPVDWDTFRERLKVFGIYWCEHVQKPAIDPQMFRAN